MKVYIKIFQTLSKQKNILRRSKKYFHSVFCGLRIIFYGYFDLNVNIKKKYEL